MNKEERYDVLYRQIDSLIAGEENLVGVLANVSSAMKEQFPSEYFWVGFYLADEKSEALRLGPFQGTVACYTIPYGKGVCGSAWVQGHTLVVADVDAFPGHIACSSLSRSEIVVPLFAGNRIWGVLDIDSTELGTFDDVDRIGLERIAPLLSHLGEKCLKP